MANAAITFVLDVRDNVANAFAALRNNASRTVAHVQQQFQQLRYAPAFYGTLFNIPIPASIGQGIQNIRTGFSNMAATARSAWATVGTAASLAGVSIGLTVAGVITAIIRMNTEYQRMQTQLKTFEGSQGAANAVLADLKQLAVELPFSLRNITQAYIELRAIGVAPTEKMLRDFSDIAAAMGMDVVNVAHGVRRAIAGELDPLETATGGTFRVMGDKIRATFRGITTDIGRDANSIIKYLQTMAQTNFAGAATQTNTLGMAFSNLGDAIYNAATALGEAGFSQTVINATKNVTELTKAITGNAVAIQVSWDRTAAIAVAAFDTIMFVPRALLGAIRTVTAVIAMLVGVGVLAIESLVVGALASLRQLYEGVTDDTDNWIRRAEESVRGAAQRTRDGILGVGREAGDGAKQFTGAFDSIGGSYARLGDTFSATHQLMRQNQSDLAQREAEQFRQARDHAMELQGLEVRKRAGQQLTVAEQQQHAALLKQLQIEQNALVREHNELLRQNDPATKDRRAQLMKLIQDIEAAQAGKLGLTANAGIKKKTTEKDPILEKIQDLAKLIPFERERERALDALTKLEAAQHAELAKGNLKLEERVQRYQRLNAIQAAFDAAFGEHIERLILFSRTSAGAAEAVSGLEAMERRLRAVVDDGTRAVGDRLLALKQLQRVENEIAAARERAEVRRKQLEIYGTPEEHRDARDHDPANPGPRLPIDQTPVTPGERFGAKELGLPDGTEFQIQATQRAQILDAMGDSLAKIAGRETVWTRMAAGMRRGRSEAELLRDTIDDIASISLSGLGDAMMAAGEAIGSGSRSAGRALMESMLGAISQIGSALGRMFLAQAAASFASVTAPPPIGPNPGGVKAGAGYLAAAAAAFAVSGLASGMASRVGGGGGGGSRSFSDDFGSELGRAKKHEKVFVLEGDYLDFKDPKSVDRLAHLLGEASNARVVTRTRRGSKRVR